MTTYRVDIDGKTVWTDTTDDYQGAGHFGDHLARPEETAADAPNGSPKYLYVDDVLVGIQRSHDDEAGECRIAASWLYAGSLEAADKVEAAILERDAWVMDEMATHADRNAKKALVAQAQAAI